MRRPIDRTRGRIDVLINNAGISQVAPALDFSTEDFRHEIEIDRRPFALARDVARDAITNGRPASIINIGSILGEVGGGKLRVPGYAAAKGGLHNLTRELASQWGRKGVRERHRTGLVRDRDERRHVQRRRGPGVHGSGRLMGRPGIEGELDGAMLYLASDASSFVTGHVLQVSGGWTAT